MHKAKRKRIEKPFDKSSCKLVSSTVVAQRNGVDYSSVVVQYNKSKREELEEFIDNLRD